MSAHSNVKPPSRQGFPDNFPTVEQGAIQREKSLPQAENSATISYRELSMKWMLSALLFLIAFSSMAAGPAVLVEEVEVPSQPSHHPRKSTSTQEITPLSQRTSLSDVYQGQEFDNIFEMRMKRRVGVGATALGSNGLLGAMLELNFSPSESIITSFGGGPGYGSFGFQWKHIFGGRFLSPYGGLGYSRWYNASGDGRKIEKTTPNELGSKFLDDEEKRTGKFGVNLFIPTLGLQYSFLAGPWTGTALFGEVNFLTPFTTFSPAPVAGLGALYYF